MSRGESARGTPHQSPRPWVALPSSGQVVWASARVERALGGWMKREIPALRGSLGHGFGGTEPCPPRVNPVLKRVSEVLPRQTVALSPAQIMSRGVEESATSRRRGDSLTVPLLRES